MRLIPLMFCAAACGGVSAEAPLTVKLGLTHDQTEQALRGRQFCLETSSSVVKHTQQKQTYPRCKRAASEKGEAWVIARYDGDKLVELRRFERFGDENHAVERFNELVAERAKLSPSTPEAEQQIKSGGKLEPGTKMVKAFAGDNGTVVGVYLLTPSPPENANVLEKITYVK